jgi:hypothetical protein
MTVFGIEVSWLAAVGLGVTAVGLAAATMQYRRDAMQLRDGATLADLEPGETVECTVDEVPADEPGTVDVPEPDLARPRFGVASELWAVWRDHKKKRRLGKKGYVRWQLVGETWEPARYIKPKKKAGGLGEYELDGETYLFPVEAMRPSPRYGMQTVIHKRGISDPINLSDPAEYAVPADVLKEYLTKRVTSTAPGLLDKLDVDTSDAIKIAIAVVIVAAAAQQYL